MDLGNFLRTMRVNKSLTMDMLAEGICTPKYIYLIEKNKRIPSVTILDAIGQKLNIEVFEYLPYLDSIDPIGVHKYCKLFDKSRKANDYAYIEALNEEAMMLEDFSNKPWIYEIEFNKIKIDMFRDKKYEVAFQSICRVLKSENLSLEPSKLELSNLSATVIQFYNLLSIYYRRIGDCINQVKYLEKLVCTLEEKKTIVSYQRIYVSVMLNLMKAYSNNGRYEETITLGHVLKTFQLENGLVDLLGVTYYVLAKCMYHLNNEDVCLYFEKAFYINYGLDYLPYVNDIFEFLSSVVDDDNTERIAPLINKLSLLVK